MLSKFFIFFIDIYQKYKFTSPSCRFYPSCSNYAKLQFSHNSIIKAVWFTIFRILRCNQLFSGGFDYPIINIKFTKNMIQPRKIVKIRFWFIPIKKDKFYVIKAI